MIITQECHYHHHHHDHDDDQEFSPLSPAPLTSSRSMDWGPGFEDQHDNISISRYYQYDDCDDDDDDDNHCRQRPSSLKKSTSLVSTTSPQSYLGSGTNHNPHLATATEITRWHIQCKVRFELPMHSNGDIFESRLDVSGLGTFPPDVEATVRYNFVKNHHCNQHHCQQYHCNQHHCNQHHCQQYHCH